MEDRTREIKQNEKSKGSLPDLWDTNKWTNICIMRLPEREKRERAEKLFKGMMAENFSNLGREMDIQIQKAEII